MTALVFWVALACSLPKAVRPRVDYVSVTKELSMRLCELCNSGNKESASPLPQCGFRASLAPRESLGSVVGWASIQPAGVHADDTRCPPISHPALGSARLDGRLVARLHSGLGLAEPAAPLRHRCHLCLHRLVVRKFPPSLKSGRQPADCRSALVRG